MELSSGNKALSKLSRKQKPRGKMKREELRMPLPEELVERILAMVPFPQIFKARALSKSWHARLSSISSQVDEEKKLLAVSFQKLVSEWSHRWNTYCHVYHIDDFLMAYDHASQHWITMPTLSVHLEENAKKLKVHLLGRPLYDPSIVGPLVYVTTGAGESRIVMNILTGSWKELPAVPDMDGQFSAAEWLVTRKEMYQLFVMYTGVGCGCLWIYNSKSRAWRSKRVEVLEVLKDFMIGWNGLCLDGVRYLIVHVQKMVWGFLLFDIEDETFNLHQMPPNGILRSDAFLRIVGCNGTVYVVTHDIYLRTTILLEVDLVSRRWSKVIRGPTTPLAFGSFWRNASSDRDYFFFEAEEGRRILAYHTRKDEWSSVAKIRNLEQYSLAPHTNVKWNCSFQPGMNPFLEA